MPAREEDGLAVDHRLYAATIAVKCKRRSEVAGSSHRDKAIFSIVAEGVVAPADTARGLVAVGIVVVGVAPGALAFHQRGPIRAGDLAKPSLRKSYPLVGMVGGNYTAKIPLRLLAQFSRPVAGGLLLSSHCHFTVAIFRANISVVRTDHSPDM